MRHPDRVGREGLRGRRRHQGICRLQRRRGRALAERGQRTLFDAIALSRTPFLAAIGGFALGGGLELALACHIRIASDTARMGLPEVTLGLIPGYGGTQRLARIVGSGRAMEMILSARMVKADEALSMGLVSQVVARPEPWTMRSTWPVA